MNKFYFTRKKYVLRNMSAFTVYSIKLIRFNKRFKNFMAVIKTTKCFSK